MSQRMANLDAVWLHMEEPSNLMVVVALLWFHQPVDWSRLKARLNERLIERYPRFRQRVAEHAVGNPSWEDDPTFRVEAHLHHVALPAPGDKAALSALVSDLMSTPLDFSTSPWQMHLVDGYQGGCAMIARIHHCIADGISLARLLLSLADEDHPGGVSAAVPEEDVAPGFHPITSVRRALHRTRQVASSALGQSIELLTQPSRLAKLARSGVAGAEELGHLLALPADPPSVFRGELGVLKSVAWAPPLPLAELKQTCRALGCTLNDALISAVAGSIGRYLREQADPVDQIRAFVPVNMRPLDRPVPRTLGNRFSLVLLELPVGEADPAARLALVKARMDTLKGGVQAVVNFGLLNAIGATPERVERVVVDIFGSKASAIMTNVPGPRAPLHLAGVQIAGMQFWVPQSGHVGLGVSIFSYAGEVTVSVACDAGLVSDPSAVIAGFGDEVQSLHERAQQLQ